MASTFFTKLKELIPGTPEYETLINSERKARSVMDAWARGETVASQLRNRIETNKDFYTGERAQQINESQAEGSLRIVTNIGATVIDLIMYILTNTPPSVQVIPASASKLDQIEASIKEDLVKKAFEEAGFKKKFRNSVMTALMSGYVDWYPFWNTDTEFGKNQNRFDITILHPLNTRIIFSGTDFERVESFITLKRYTPEWVYEKYGIEVFPDSENPFMDREIYGEGIEDGKVSIFKEYDSKNVTTVIDNEVVKVEAHKLDFAPIIHTENKSLLNEAYGQDEFSRFLPLAKEINVLISAASEIARDLAYPPLLEYNTALGGKKLTKLRSNKIQVRRTDKGESLEFMTNKAQIGPLLEQIRLLIDLFHFVALMPKAAAGIFESSVTSGFQAKLAMQPATLSSDNKKIDYDASIVKLARIALYYIEKNDPSVLSITSEDGSEIKLENIWEGQFEVIWPENLPIDISREIQNLVIGIQNSLTSVTQAVDKYNALMNMGSPEDTKDYLRQEAEDAELSPDRALKVASVKKTLSDIQQALQAVQSSVSGQGPMKDLAGAQQEITNSQNTNNNAKAVSSINPGANVPDTAREAVPTESTQGVTLGGI